MIIDTIGTEYRAGRLILPDEWKRDRTRPVMWWTPQGDRTTYKVVLRSLRAARSRMRPFAKSGNSIMASILTKVISCYMGMPNQSLTGT